MADLSNVHGIDEAVTQHIGEGRTYSGVEDGLEFRATFDPHRDIVYIFLPGRSTQRTMIKPIERIAVWRHWMKTKSYTPADYKDIGRNPAFMLSVLKQIAD